MKIVVTGAAGFIGSCIIWKLNEQGEKDVIAVDKLDATDKWKNLVGKTIEDYVDKDGFLRKLEAGKFSCDMIVHMGACSSTTETNADFLMENNYLYTKRLAEWCLAKDIPFLYASSAATYGAGELGYSDSDEVTLKLKPLNPYGYSKQLFDLWVVKNNLQGKVTGFKFFNVFGPNEYHKDEMRSVICKTFEKVLAEKKIRLFKSYRRDFADGEQKRDFVYVKDAVEIVLHFIRNPQKKGIFNIGTGCARSWNDVAAALFAALGMEPDIEYIEMPPQIRPRYQYFTQADLAKLRRAGISHAFYSLEDAVKDYVGYLRETSYL
ncbi:MAG: ADP-glyceromanno-heptose 6-epimerase [Deltaproteobacteria bacterium]